MSELLSGSIVQNVENIVQENVINGFYERFYIIFYHYTPRVVGALIIICVGVLVAILAYKFIMYIFNKFRIIVLIDELFISIKKQAIEEEFIQKKTRYNTKIKASQTNVKKEKIEKISSQIKIDVVVGKSISYYLFLVFFRWAIMIIGIEEVEKFLGELNAYLVNLFIAVVILFFGIRFANFVYDVVYNALDLTRQKTAKVIATIAQVIVLFFTLIVALPKVGVDTMIINTILIGFISMLALAGGLAFGFGGKDIAKDILEHFKK